MKKKRKYLRCSKRKIYVFFIEGCEEPVAIVARTFRQSIRFLIKKGINPPKDVFRETFRKLLKCEDNDLEISLIDIGVLKKKTSYKYFSLNTFLNKCPEKKEDYN